MCFRLYVYIFRNMSQTGYWLMLWQSFFLLFFFVLCIFGKHKSRICMHQNAYARETRVIFYSVGMVWQRIVCRRQALAEAPCVLSSLYSTQHRVNLTALANSAECVYVFAFDAFSHVEVFFIFYWASLPNCAYVCAAYLCSAPALPRIFGLFLVVVVVCGLLCHSDTRSQ